MNTTIPEGYLQLLESELVRLHHILCSPDAKWAQGQIDKIHEILVGLGTVHIYVRSSSGVVL